MTVDIHNYFSKFYDMSPYLNIDESEWAYIKATWSMEEILDALSDVCLTYAPPMPVYDEAVISSDLSKLKGIKYSNLLIEQEWFARNSENSKYSLKYGDKYLLFTRSMIGNKASSLFHNEVRWSVDHDRNISGITSWSTKEGIIAILKAFFSFAEGMESVNRGTLQNATTLRRYIAAQFKPSIAKAFFDYYGSKNILDFSAGWGDRFAGFYASDSGLNYVGIDPNSRNTPNYIKQYNFYKSRETFFENTKTAHFIESPAEDADLSAYMDYFDMVFTSPPYFNTERYSNDPTQSWIRYKTIDEWNVGFLHKTIDNILPTVKSGGIIAVNIADVFSPGGKKYFEIVNPMNDHFASHGLNYLGAIGMQLAKRPNSGGAGTGVSEYYTDETKQKRLDTKHTAFAEPIWIWQKP